MNILKVMKLISEKDKMADEMKAVIAEIEIKSIDFAARGFNSGVKEDAAKDAIEYFKKEMVKYLEKEFWDII